MLTLSGGANAAGTPDATLAAEPGFDARMLWGKAAQSLDLRRFEKGQPMPAGAHSVDLYINGTRFGRELVEFRAGPAGPENVPCFSAMMLRRVGVAAAALPDDAVTSTGCVDLGTGAPGSSIRFDSVDQTVYIEVPQIYMESRPRGYVPPELWSEGANAGFLNYSVGSSRTPSAYGPATWQAYGNLNGGVNLGAWRLRTRQSAFAGTGREGIQRQSLGTYAERALPSLEANLQVGETFTSGRFFDSVAIRGISLSSDDRMLPDSRRGFAPAVRGIAYSNAQVTIRQNGYVIHQVSVAPGPFEINDIYPTGIGTLLEVTVTEADGRQTKFEVPFATSPLSLRAGISQFSVSGGVVRDVALPGESPGIVQGLYQRGLTDSVTVFGGAIAAGGRYAAVMAGGAFNGGWGAFSLDATSARTELRTGQNMQGQSYRAAYSKRFLDSGTTLSMAAYRYSSSGYYSTREALAEMTDTALTPFLHSKGQAQLTLTQSVGIYGNVYVTSSYQNYWNFDSPKMQYQVGYSTLFKGINLNLTLTRTRNQVGQMDNRIYAGVSFPLGGGTYAARGSAAVTHDRNGASVSLGADGIAGEERQLAYSLSARKEVATGLDSGGGGYIQYGAPYATVDASVSQQRAGTQASLSATGSVVVLPDAVVFGHSSGESIAVVHAKGAGGAALPGTVGGRLNSDGYGLVPFVTPYRLNDIEISPEGLPSSIEFQSTREQIAPTAGAIALVDFQTISGRSALLRLRLPGGDAVPFGADILDQTGLNVGLVGQGGRAFIRTKESKGVLTAQWGDNATQQCSFTYETGAGGDDEVKKEFEYICTPLK